MLTDVRNGSSLEPKKSRPPLWAIWLPAGLTAALLVVSALAFASLKHRIDHVRNTMADVLEPTNQKLVRFQLGFLADAAVLRSYAALPRPITLERFWTMHRNIEALFEEVSASAPNLGADFVHRFQQL